MLPSIVTQTLDDGIAQDKQIKSSLQFHIQSNIIGIIESSITSQVFRTLIQMSIIIFQSDFQEVFQIIFIRIKNYFNALCNLYKCASDIPDQLTMSSNINK